VGQKAAKLDKAKITTFRDRGEFGGVRQD